jgi:hypothetical protein
MENDDYSSINSSDKYINRNLNDDNFHDDYFNFSKCLQVFHKTESFLYRYLYGTEEDFLDSNDIN